MDAQGGSDNNVYSPPKSKKYSPGRALAVAQRYAIQSPIQSINMSNCRPFCLMSGIVFSTVVIALTAPTVSRLSFCTKDALSMVRLSSMAGQSCGIHGDSRCAVQDFLFSILDLPVSQGGIQKVIDSLTTAMAPHYAAIDEVAH